MQERTSCERIIPLLEKYKMAIINVVYGLNGSSSLDSISSQITEEEIEFNIQRAFEQLAITKTDEVEVKTIGLPGFPNPPMQTRVVTQEITRLTGKNLDDKTIYLAKSTIEKVKSGWNSSPELELESKSWSIYNSNAPKESWKSFLWECIKAYFKQ